jgi:hypothetical protein
MSFTRRMLDAQACSKPGCSHAFHERLWLHGRCHPSAGMRASYDAATGVLAIECRKCKKLIVEVEVAP